MMNEYRVLFGLPLFFSAMIPGHSTNCACQGDLTSFRLLALCLWNPDLRRHRSTSVIKQGLNPLTLKVTCIINLALISPNLIISHERIAVFHRVISGEPYDSRDVRQGGSEMRDGSWGRGEGGGVNGVVGVGVRGQWWGGLGQGDLRGEWGRGECGVGVNEVVGVGYFIGGAGLIERVGWVDLG